MKKKRLTLILTALLMSTVCLFAQDGWKTATLINSGSPVTRTLDAVHSGVWYKLVVPSDGTVRIDISTAVESLRWNWEFGWIDKDGNFVSRVSHVNIWTGIGDRDTLTISNAAAGTYYLRIDHKSSAGQYKLKYVHTPCSYANDIDSNNEGGTGSTLISGKTVQGHLGYRDDNNVTDSEDWYKMTVTKDGSLRVIIDQEESKTLKWNVEICWRDKDGRYNSRLSHVNIWTGHTDRDTLTIADAGVGTYYLHVSLKDGYGGYSLQYDFTPCIVNTDSEPNDDGGTGDIMSIGQSMYGHLGYCDANNKRDDSDWYKVEVPKDGTLSVSIDPIGDKTLKWNWEICWLDNNGNYSQNVARVNIWTGFSETDTLTIDYAAAGTYYVHVYLKSGYGCYKLKYDYNQYPYIDPEPNDEYANAVNLAFNSEVTGNLGYRKYGGATDGEDWYKIDNKYGFEMEFSYVPHNEEKAPDADLTLYSLENGELKQLRYEWAHYQSKIINADENLPKGTYYLKIGNRGSAAGSYRLSLGTPMRSYDSNLRVHYTGWPSVRRGIPGSFKVTVENIGDEPSPTFWLALPHTEEIKILYAEMPVRNGIQRIDVSEMGDEEYMNPMLYFTELDAHEKYTFTVWAEGYVEGKEYARANTRFIGSLCLLGATALAGIGVSMAKDKGMDMLVSWEEEKLLTPEIKASYQSATQKTGQKLKKEKEEYNIVAHGLSTVGQSIAEDFVSLAPGGAAVVSAAQTLGDIKKVAEPIRIHFFGKHSRAAKQDRFLLWAEGYIDDYDETSCVNNVVSSWDPNEMCGPVGVGDENYIGKTCTVNYRIMFENKAEATAPAYRIRISDVLDENVFDISTVRFNGTSHDNAGFGWKMNREGNKLTWDIEGIELPPNVNAPEGEGSVDFSVDLKPGLKNNAKIKNKATIIFDYNEPIETNEYVNTLDLNAPIAITDEAVLKDGKVLIRCHGLDDESGVAYYKYYTSYKHEGNQYIGSGDGEFEFAIPEGTDARDYAFMTMAVDNVGNVQEQPTAAAVVTETALAKGDANGDGMVNAADIVEVVNYIKGHPSIVFIKALADVNDDGNVNTTDLELIVNIIMGK